MKKRNYLILVLIFSFLFTNCGSENEDCCGKCSDHDSDDQYNESSTSGETDMNDFLEKYEDVVEEYESMANSGKLNFTHMSKINERIFELSEVMEKSKKNDEVNTSHLKRMNKLLLRLNTAMQKISTQ